MDVIKKMNPGDPGTKRLLAKYGDKLICVRYRNDKDKQRRVTTVELIVDEGFYLASRNTTRQLCHPSANRNVLLKIDYHETELRNKVKQAGGQWKPELKRWCIRSRQAVELGLQSRIEEIEK